MSEQRCPYCGRAFSPSKCQPKQAVCSAPECQRRRCADYRHRKVTTDPNYREACRESAREWRKQHPDYWKQYRTAHPACVERNRDLQKCRDRKQRFKSLANNTPASNLRNHARITSHWLTGLRGADSQSAPWSFYILLVTFMGISPGGARESSPWREPWEQARTARSPGGAKEPFHGDSPIAGHEGPSYAPMGLARLWAGPTGLTPWAIF